MCEGQPNQIAQVMFQPVSYLRAFSIIWGVVICPLAGLLLVSCVTWHGALFAIAALFLGLAPGLAWIEPERPWLRRFAFVAFGTWLAIAIWLTFVSPDGRPRDGSRVQNRYVGGAWHYQRNALGALLPEVDQFMLGFKLVPAVDTLFTMRQARSLANLTSTIYAELEVDEDFHALGSAMPDAYDDLWGRHFDKGHYFLYVPPSLDRRTHAPALVFLHGSGGNFKAYTWLLSRVADELGMVLIAPSFGMGNWDAKNGTRSVASALEDAAKVVPVDMSRVHLAGLSNGGLGVSQVAASSAGRRFCSLIFLSPVCDDSALGSGAFANLWREKPVLVIIGEADDRVPLEYVSRCAATMRTAGAMVELTAYPSADHFLLFSHRDRCLDQISGWLKRNAIAPPSSQPR